MLPAALLAPYLSQSTAATLAAPTYHSLGGLDLAIIAGYILLSVGIGIAMSRRSRRSLADFFASGGKLPWYLLGTSMIATSFAADTPLALSGMVYSEGISGNWFWWNGAAMALAGVFLFAPLWQRAKLVTDNELVYLRYSGRPAHALRGFRALYFSLIYACIVLGWVNLAMVKIVSGLVEPETVAWEVVDRPVEAVLRTTGFVASDPIIAVGLEDATRSMPVSIAILPPTTPDGGGGEAGAVSFVVSGLPSVGGVVRDRVVTLQPGATVADAATALDDIDGLAATIATAWGNGSLPAERLQESTIEVAPGATGLVERLGKREWRDGITLAAGDTTVLRADRQSADEIAVQVLTAKVLILCLALTIVYCALGGLWGVVVTDFFQFFIAMAGSIWLAWVAVSHFGGFGGLVDALHTTYGSARADAMLAMVPGTNQAELATAIAADPGVVGAAGPFRLMTFSRWLMFVLVVWYALGFTDGGSYLGQRMIAARSERDAALGYLWYAVGHFAIRMWPWLLVGAAGAALFPTLADQQAALPALGGYDAEYNYILVMRRFLGPGLLGVVVASFLAAYMSTVSTHVNLAAGYLVNDFYRPFIRPEAGDRHLVVASTIATIGVGAIGTVVTLYMNSIKSAWFLLASLNAGIGIVYILRWYWWRINAWSEIACFASVLIGTLALTLVSWGATFDKGLGAGASPSGLQLAWYRVLENNEWLETANASVASALTVEDVSVALINESSATNDIRVEAEESAKLYEELTGSTVPAGQLALKRDVSFSLTAFPYNYLLLVPWTILCWLSVTLLTKPVNRAHLHAFYRRVRPGGPGWRAIAAELPDVADDDSPLSRRSFTGWLMAAGGLYAALFGVGALITGAPIRALILLAITVACGIGLWRHFSSDASTDRSRVEKADHAV